MQHKKRKRRGNIISSQKINRIIAGLKAKSSGSAFEKNYKAACDKAGIACIRLPELGATFIKEAPLIRKGIVCDFIIAKKNKVCLIDTKAFSKNKLAYSDVYNKASFKKQVEELAKFQKKGSHSYQPAILTGFVFYFSKADSVRFFTTSQIQALKPRSSLDKSEGKKLGSLHHFNPFPA